MYIKKCKKMHTGRNFGEKTLLSWKSPKFVGINLTNAAKVIKVPNAAELIKALHKQLHN